MGGLGLKNPHYFSKALAAKGAWRILRGEGLWVTIVHKKYISPLTIEEWFRIREKSIKNVSIICKLASILVFEFIGDWLEWRVGNERKIRLGQEPCVAYGGAHKIPILWYNS